MKTKFHLLALVFLLFSSCIGEDVIDDFVEAEIRLLNPIETISISDSYQFDVSFFNNIGQLDPTVQVNWSSSDESVATISQSGLLTPVSAGTTVISASTTLNNNLIEETLTIDIIDGDITPVQLETKSGTIRTTSSYLLEGSFTISEIENSSDLIISVDDDYRASASLPGLYLYLTNNPNSIDGAYEVGRVSTFIGSHTYTIPDTRITDFRYLLYWCKPFVVKVGDGEILDD